jgi:hypothetical protein
MTFTPGRLFLLELLTLALIWQASQNVPARAQDLQDSQIDIAYVAPKNTAFQPYYEELKRRQVLEELQQFLSPLRLPRKILVKTDECSTNTAPYDSGKPIIVCYEYIARIVELAPAVTTSPG